MMALPALAAAVAAVYVGKKILDIFTNYQFAIQGQVARLDCCPEQHLIF